jgi:predicted Fe-Mo cluster-binding NifX family protein
MRIAIPLEGGRLCMHFGHCQAFALVDVNEDTGQVLDSTQKTPPPHEPGVLPQWLNDEGVRVVIAGGMGQRAQQLFQQADIQTVVGAPSDTPGNLVRAYMDGSLQPGQNICDH